MKASDYHKLGAAPLHHGDYKPYSDLSLSKPPLGDYKPGENTCLLDGQYQSSSFSGDYPGEVDGSGYSGERLYSYFPPSSTK